MPRSGRAEQCSSPRRVVIAVDPHKLSVTIEARDNREILRATGRFGTDARSHRQLLEVARQWPERIWAVEERTGSAARWRIWPPATARFSIRRL